MSKTFEGFQLVLNFVLFLTLALFFSVHEKYKLAKISGSSKLPGKITPEFLGLRMRNFQGTAFT